MSVHKILALAVLCWAIGAASLAQHPDHTRPDEQLWTNALRLYEQTEYAAAAAHFQELQQALESGLDGGAPSRDNLDRRITVRYYLAACALYARQADAEMRLAAFANEYPHHPRTLDLYQAWGDDCLQRGEYSQAIAYLAKANDNGQTEGKIRTLKAKIALAYYQQQRYTEAEAVFDQLKTNRDSIANAAAYYAAVLAYRNQNFEKASLDFDKAEQAPEYALKVPVFKADIYFRQTQYKKLFQYTEPLLTTKKNLDQLDKVYLLTGEAFYELRDYQKAVEYYQAYLGFVDSLSAAVEYRIGYAYYQLREYPRAVQYLSRQALNNSLTAQYAAYYLGLVYLQQGSRYFAANALWRAAHLRYDAEITQSAYWLYAKANFELARYDECATTIQEMLAQYPRHENIREAQNMLEKALIKSNAVLKEQTQIKSYLDSPTLAFRRGIACFNQGDYRSAVDAFRHCARLSRTSDTSEIAKYWLAESFVQMGQSATAVPYYQEILDLSNKFPQYTSRAHFGLGYAYYLAGRYAMAIPHLQAYLLQSNDEEDQNLFQNALLRLADSFFATKDYEQAYLHYTQAIERNYAEKDYAYYRRGQIGINLERLREALADFQACINTESPYNDAAVCELAFAHLQQNNVVAAINLLQELLQRNPQTSARPQVYYTLAQAYHALGNKNDALRYYTQYIQEFPNLPAAPAALAVAQDLSADETADALTTQYNEATMRDDKIAQRQYKTAQSAMEQGNYAEAINEWTTFMKQYPRYVESQEAQYNLAECYHAERDKELAKMAYQRVIANNTPDFLSASACRLGSYAQSEQNYAEAINFYHLALQTMDNRAVQTEAYEGLMQIYFDANRLDSAAYFARRLMVLPNHGESQQQARLYLAQIQYKQNDYSNALRNLQLIYNQNTVCNATERRAQYYVAEIWYKQGQYTNALLALYAIRQQLTSVPSDELGRVLLLIADNYLALREVYQAQAVWQYIIDKLPNTTVAVEAKNKQLGNKNK